MKIILTAFIISLLWGALVACLIPYPYAWIVALLGGVAIGLTVKYLFYIKDSVSVPFFPIINGEFSNI